MDGSTKAMRSPVPRATSGYLGDLVAWRFGNFSAPRRKIVSIFSNLGFQAEVEHDLSAPKRALAQAFRSGIDYGRNIVAKPMDRPNKDTPYAVGIYEKVGRQGEGGDDWPCGARVRIDTASGTAVALAPDGGVAIESCLAVAGMIAERANRLVEQVENTELSHAIVAVGRRLNWANFRSSGGVYWVPAVNAERLRRLFDELEACGEFFATAQPLFGDDAGRTMRNVNQAAASAIAQEIERIAQEVEEAKTGKVGKRGLESRMTDCAEVLVRAQLYREVLQDELASIETSLAGFTDEFADLMRKIDRKDAFDMAGVAS